MKASDTHLIPAPSGVSLPGLIAGAGSVALLEFFTVNIRNNLSRLMRHRDLCCSLVRGGSNKEHLHRLAVILQATTSLRKAFIVALCSDNQVPSSSVSAMVPFRRSLGFIINA
jgi:hypothetical protein